MKLGVLLAGAAVIAAACAPAEEQPDIPILAQSDFAAHVPDQLNDVGRGASVAIDPEGNVSVSYLLYKPTLRAGEIPPPVIAGEPQPPAVLVATLGPTGWTKVSVTPQGGVGDEAVGLAQGIATSAGKPLPWVTTALAVDGQGNQHVVWNSAQGLFYATGAGGSFGEPEKVTGGPNRGASIAVGADGIPWVSYYEGLEVKAARRSGGAWSAESVAGISRLVRGAGVLTAIGVTGQGAPLVAFGDGDVTKLARRSADGSWTEETVPSPGGFSVSIAVDANGNPHLAYVASAGDVRHAHSIGGGAWEVTELGTVGSEVGGDEAKLALLGTDIAVDGEGVHYVAWNDLARRQVLAVSNASGSFEPLPLPAVTGGADPSIAVSEDGRHLGAAWYDQLIGNLVVVSPAGEELTLAYSPQPRVTPTATGPPPAECEPEPGVTELEIVAPPGASVSGFDETCLAVEPGTPLTTLFRNEDPGQLHNWSLYTDSSAQSRPPGAPGDPEIITGPDENTYEVGALDAAEYFYRCDVHPTTMTGTLVVAEAGGG